jgi:hypothetical protein
MFLVKVNKEGWLPQSKSNLSIEDTFRW